MKLWIFLGGYHKTGLFLGVISKQSRVFSLRLKYRIGIFWGLLTFNDFWGDA